MGWAWNWRSKPGARLCDRATPNGRPGPPSIWARSSWTSGQPGRHPRSWNEGPRQPRARGPTSTGFDAVPSSAVLGSPQATWRERARLSDGPTTSSFGSCFPGIATFVFAWDAYVDAALIRATLGDGTKAAADLTPLIRMWERDGFREAVAEGHLALARLAARAHDPEGAARAARVAADESEASGLPGTSWRARAFLSTLPGAAPEHAVAARSIVADLTSSLTDHTLAEVLDDDPREGVGRIDMADRGERPPSRFDPGPGS